MISQGVVCLLVLVAFLQVTFAEPPVNSNGNSIVSSRLLRRVANIIANGGDGSSRDDDGQQEGPSIVDQQLLDRVARILSTNEGQISWEQKAKARSLPQTDGQYGATPGYVPEVKEIVGPQYELSPPERVPRIAAFDISGDSGEDGQGYNGGDQLGYSASEIVQDTYADNGNRFQGGSNIELEAPKNAERIAAFDIEGETPPAPFTPPQASRGGGGQYFTNNH